MRIIERLEHAQAQTWWLPDSAQLYETDDACAYFSGGQFNIVRFQPSPENVRARLNALCERIGDVPATFHFFPHRHDESVRHALIDAGFSRGISYEARAIHVNDYDRQPPHDLDVVTVASLDDMRRVYAIRARVFGGRPEASEDSLRRYLEDATGPNARVRQFLVVDGESREPLCQAGMSFYPDVKVAFLFAGGTLEAARGRGAYTALVAARVAYARAAGIEYVGLFAREGTSAPIVARQGFEHYGELQNWTLNQSV